MENPRNKVNKRFSPTRASEQREVKTEIFPAPALDSFGCCVFISIFKIKIIYFASIHFIALPPSAVVIPAISLLSKQAGFRLSKLAIIEASQRVTVALSSEGSGSIAATQDEQSKVD